jgi:imidazolonepropionase-like amidohydrolase
MKRLSLFVSALIIQVCAFTQIQIADIAINHVNVITMDEQKMIVNCSVLIKDGQIVGFVKSLKAKIRAKQNIDGTGKFLIPGLNDMHVHWPDSLQERFFNLCALAGITNVRIMSSAKETIPFFANSNKSSKPNAIIGFPIRTSDSIPDAHIPMFVDSVKKAGYAFIKIFGLHPNTNFEKLSNETKKAGLFLCGHALGNVNPYMLMKEGYRSIEHVGYFDKAKRETQMDSLIASAKANGTFVCPTLDWTNMVYHSYPKDSLPYRAGYAIGKNLYGKTWDSTYNMMENTTGEATMKQYKDILRKNVAAKIDILAKLKKNEIRLIAGSDAEEPYQTPGFSLLEELLLIQKAGYSNEELLAMVTTNAASFFAYKKTNGRIENNQAANLVLLSANPLTDIRNLNTLVWLIKDGIAYPREMLLKSVQ